MQEAGSPDVQVSPLSGKFEVLQRQFLRLCLVLRVEPTLPALCNTKQLETNKKVKKTSNLHQKENILKHVRLNKDLSLRLFVKELRNKYYTVAICSLF